MKTFKSILEAKKQISAASYTSQEALNLINQIYEPQLYIKQQDALVDKEQFTMQQELDKMMAADENFKYYDEFEKKLKEIESKYYDNKYYTSQQRLNDIYDKIESGMTRAEINKLPRRGGYRHNLIKAFLNKYINQ